MTKVRMNVRLVVFTSTSSEGLRSEHNLHLDIFNFDNFCYLLRVMGRVSGTLVTSHMDQYWGNFVLLSRTGKQGRCGRVDIALDT